ncbi:MAG: serine hydrolase domain-containing protein [Verrucomicrobiota bacterium]
MRYIKVERIREIFAENFLHLGELGASVSVWKNGTEVLAMTDGFCDRQRTKLWLDSTLVLLWSATKGPASACVLHCLQEHRLSLETRVSEIWPEFAAAGKEAITMGELLSHRAGLAAMSSEVPVFDYDAVIDALARQAPVPATGSGPAYHPRTFGFLLDEMVRRLGGMTLGEYWRETFAIPLGLDLWIGLPENQTPRVAPVHAPRSAPPNDAFWTEFSNPDSLTFRAFASPRGLQSVGSMNTPEARAVSFPGFGGIGNARSLAKFYAMLANGGEFNGKRYFHEPALGWMAARQSGGHDEVLQIETAFSAGFMKDPTGHRGKKTRFTFGPSLHAFGQPGAGGSVAFADPENNIAFAYVMNQMEPGVLPGEKAMRLIEALYS